MCYLSPRSALTCPCCLLQAAFKHRFQGGLVKEDYDTRPSVRNFAYAHGHEGQPTYMDYDLYGAGGAGRGNVPVYGNHYKDQIGMKR